MKRGNWFKGKEEKEPWDEFPVSKSSGRVRKRKPFKKAGKGKLKKAASTVVFVPSTRGSLLVKSLRDDEDRMEELTGFRVKYQEAGGSVLINAFNKNLGLGKECGRKECPICKQEETGVDCKARNVMYESRCKICNPHSNQEEDKEDDDQPRGRPSTHREGLYIGESSRSIHERALEHVRDAKSFSVKSHIVKHWMSAHPSLPTPPEMEFKVTGKFKDCLSRQISEALRINNSEDILLNSKGEYGNNCVSRLVVQEDAWVRKERDRLEEEQAEQTKRQVDMFRHQKMKQVAGLDLGVSMDIILDATEDGREGSVTAQTGTQCNIVDSQPVIYETDDEEFSGDGDDIQSSEAGQGGSVTALTGTMCNIVKAQTVIYETDDEEFPGDDIQSYEAGQEGSVTALTGTMCNMVKAETVSSVPSVSFETDEEEFLGEEDAKPAVSTTFSALYSVQVPQKRKNTAKRNKQPYHLAYFSLWWMRMEVEGRKDDRKRRKREEEETKSKRKRSVNTQETVMRSIEKFESCLDIQRELEGENAESLLILGEGAIQLSSGFVENNYLDGTNFDGNQDLIVVKAANCKEMGYEQKVKADKH